MTRREKLHENYEDALFALLMDEVAEQEGMRLLEENERLRQDPEAAIPDKVNNRCLKTINRAFAKRRHHKIMYTMYRVFNRAAVIAVIVMILVGTAYAAFPEVRIRTLNLMIEVSDVASSLSLTRENIQSSELNDETSISNDEETLSGYRLPKISDEFLVIDEVHRSSCSWITYKNNLGDEITISIYAANGLILNVDTEDAQHVENIQVHGYDGLLVEKNGCLTIAWGDTDQNNLIEVEFTGIDRAVALNCAESIEFVTAP